MLKTAVILFAYFIFCNNFNFLNDLVFEILSDIWDSNVWFKQLFNYYKNENQY